jgi:hypothetical protein
MYICNGALNYVAFGEMDWTGDHHGKPNKPDSGRWICIFSLMWNLDMKKRDMNIKGAPFQWGTSRRMEGEKVMRRVICKKVSCFLICHQRTVGI